MEALYESLSKGGVVMVPIVLCSVTALAIFLERLWALQRNRVLPSGLIALVSRSVREGRPAEAETLCSASSATAARVLQAGIRRRGRPRSIVKEAMEETGRREISFLQRYVGGLGTIAAVTPLLGLLGTVAGMIRVFKQVVDEVGARGQVNPGSLANGIWEALVTTAAGLSVAIPAYVAYRYLESRIDGLAIDLEERALDLLDDLEGDAEAEGAAAGARDGAAA